MPHAPPSPMALALQLAQRALTVSRPNPRVGCVLVNAQGQIIGQGHTQPVGGPHAEVMALRDAAAAGASVRGSTAYVTLEPCSHQGRTGPCCEALIEAGVRRVVAAIGDPNPQVAGQGLARLRAAGVAVQLLPPTDPLAQASRELNIGFFSRMQRGRPWVRMKIAASLDGQTALDNGRSQWITSPAARTDGQAWRARACAVLTGIGTLRTDNPRLTVRDVPCTRQPDLVVLDSGLQTRSDALIFEAPRQVLIYTVQPDAQRQQTLVARGAQVIPGPATPDAASAKLDLGFVLRDLARREVNEVHVEAGFKLNGSLVRGDWVDEYLIYLAPKLLGSAQGMVNLGTLSTLEQGPALEFLEFRAVGPDLCVRARPPGRELF